MTQTKQFALHIISLVLMVLTIHVAYQLSYDFAHYFFFVLGCFSFGVAWNKLTNYLIYKHD
jgi:hypothetical protein